MKKPPTIALFRSFALTMLSALVFACSASATGLDEGEAGEDDPSAEDEEAAKNKAADDPTKDYGTSYSGFGDVQLSASRLDNAKGSDRSRVKPFSALQTEYQRVLGNKPASIDEAAQTFGRPAANWYVEPQASAISLITAYSVAFDGCLTYAASKPEMRQAPTEATAATQCKAMTRKFWSRDATPDEVTACTKVATKATSSEPDASRKWAYTCAAVLTASGFVSF